MSRIKNTLRRADGLTTCCFAAITIQQHKGVPAECCERCSQVVVGGVQATEIEVVDWPVCPRCGHYIPNDERPGAYMGARSRADNKTEVCSACGTHEAMQQFMSDDHSCTPISEWPVPEYREVKA